MASGKVKDEDKFCKIDKEDRLSQCNTDCQHAGSTKRRKDACRFGCQFWGNGQFFFCLLSASLISTIFDSPISFRHYIETY